MTGTLIAQIDLQAIMEEGEEILRHTEIGQRQIHAVLDHDANASHTIRVRVTDAHNAYIEKVFVITVLSIPKVYYLATTAGLGGSVSGDGNYTHGTNAPITATSACFAPSLICQRWIKSAPLE